MTVCSMFGCKNRMHKGCGKHFFRFPLKDPERLEKWIEAVQRDGWKPTLHSKVCSDHFTEKDYMIRPGAACPYLRVDAIPTPLVILQRKKKSKKRKYTKDVTVLVLDDEPVEKKAVIEQPGRAVEEAPEATQGAEKDNNKETEEKGQGKGVGPTQDITQESQNQQGVEHPAGEMERDALSQERAGARCEWPARQVTQLNDSLLDGMEGITIHKETTQSERQVALILAGLEDTHCEMQAAEARAARENATAASSDNDSSIDNMPEYIPFDHAYTTLTASDKENDTPAAMPATAPTPDPTPTPTPTVTLTPTMALNPKAAKLRKKIKTLQKQVLRQGVKIKSLKQTLGELRKGNMVEKEPERVISEHCSGLAMALFTNQLRNRHRKCSGLQYTNMLKDFALELYSASPKAYKFCRLFLSLPHPVSLRHWKSANETGQGAPTEEGAAVVVVQEEEEEHADVLQATLAQTGVLQNETGLEEAPLSQEPVQ